MLITRGFKSNTILARGFSIARDAIREIIRLFSRLTQTFFGFSIHDSEYILYSNITQQIILCSQIILKVQNISKITNNILLNSKIILKRGV